MTPIIIESPFAANQENSEDEHVKYARRCLRDSLLRGEAPYASHLLYTQAGVLRDDVPEERKHGIEAGFVWRDRAERSVFYTDYGISGGMKLGIADLEKKKLEVEYRTIGRNPQAPKRGAWKTFLAFLGNRD